MRNIKKLFLVTIAVIFVSFLSNIQPSQAKADEPKTFIGTIESFRPVMGRPPKWPIARFTAVADNGEKIEIYVLGRDTTVPYRGYLSGVFDKGAFQGISEAAAAPFSCNQA